jgi:peptide chain release factor 1
MFDKLLSVENKYDELMTKLGTAEVQADAAEYRRAAKTLAELEPLVQKFRDYKSVEQDIQGPRARQRHRREMRELAREELKTLEVRRDALLQDLKILLIPKDPNDEKNVILEIRAGTGGDEAALFAADSVPHVQPLRREAGVAHRRDVHERERHRRSQGSNRLD